MLTSEERITLLDEHLETLTSEELYSQSKTHESTDESEVKIVPFRPLPFRDGNKVLNRYTEPFTDRIGNEADITYVDYLDKKGKLHERFVMYIVWRKK